MKVIFKKLFFGPDGYRRRAGIVHEVPDHWTLPKGTQIVTAEVIAAPAKTEEEKQLDFLEKAGLKKDEGEKVDGASKDETPKTDAPKSIKKPGVNL